MRREAGAPMIIMSLNLGLDATVEALRDILHRSVAPVQGCYEGVDEWSVLLHSKEFNEHRTELVALLNKHSQQSILYLDGQRNAYLVYGPMFDWDVLSRYIGELVSRRTEAVVTRPQAYTIVGEYLYYVQ